MNINKLRYTCFKVLPLVYDESLSYYEVVCKVAEKINELIEYNTQLSENISEEISKEIQEQLENGAKLEVIDTITKAIAPTEPKTYTTDTKVGGEVFWLTLNNKTALYECIKPMESGGNYIVGANIKEIDLQSEIKYISDFICKSNEGYNTIAKNNHEINSLFIYKDNLVKATTNIGIGDDIETKCTVVSLAELEFTNFKNIESNKTDITNLKQADITLQNNIDGEINARTDDIENVNSAINTEKEERISADNVINKKVTKNSNDIMSVTASLNEYWKTIYPVGSIYISTSSTFNPQTTWGGTWKKTADGRCLIGANDTYPLGSTGGEAEHKLLINEIPSHTHTIESGTVIVRNQNDGNITYANNNNLLSSSPNTKVTYAGGSESHNNMQPYLAVYIWERTA